MSRTAPSTVRELLITSYANLAMAHAAVSADAESFGKVHYMIRSRVQKGLMTGTMRLGSLYDDERVKMQIPRACCYCASPDDLDSIPIRFPPPARLRLWVTDLDSTPPTKPHKEPQTSP